MIVDFETLPGGIPIDNLPISDQYEPEFGIRFRLDIDGDGLPDPDPFPFLEQQGGDDNSPHGFTSDLLGLADTAASGYEDTLGQFFLRGPAGDYPPFNLVVLYSTPVCQALGQIWDIDGSGTENSEQWRVEAMGRDYVYSNDPGNVLDFVCSPNGTDATLDAKPWTFSFDTDSPDIFALRITFVGTKTTNIGVAFDNFSSVLYPSAAESRTWGGIKGLYR